eukprot:SAG31_NODE_15127_length_769_cov_1.161194_1_plen_70_part_10
MRPQQNVAMIPMDWWQLLVSRARKLGSSAAGLTCTHWCQISHRSARRSHSSARRRAMSVRSQTTVLNACP